MKPEAILKYTHLYEKINNANDEEAMKKLLIDEVGARSAWKVVECLDQFKGFEQGFWFHYDMSDECRDNIFNELANAFRDKPYHPEWAEE